MSVIFAGGGLSLETCLIPIINHIVYIRYRGSLMCELYLEYVSILEGGFPMNCTVSVVYK
jgi:hypothetical protein